METPKCGRVTARMTSEQTIFYGGSPENSQVISSTQQLPPWSPLDAPLADAISVLVGERQKLEEDKASIFNSPDLLPIDKMRVMRGVHNYTVTIQELLKSQKNKLAKFTDAQVRQKCTLVEESSGLESPVPAVNTKMLSSKVESVARGVRTRLVFKPDDSDKENIDPTELSKLPLTRRKGLLTGARREPLKDITHIYQPDPFKAQRLTEQESILAQKVKELELTVQAVEMERDTLKRRLQKQEVSALSEKVDIGTNTTPKTTTAATTTCAGRQQGGKEEEGDLIVFKQRIEEQHTERVQQALVMANRVKELEGAVQTVTKELSEKNQLLESTQQLFIEHEQSWSSQVKVLTMERDTLKKRTDEQEITAAETARTVETATARIQDLEAEIISLRHRLEEQQNDKETLLTNRVKELEKTVETASQQVVYQYQQIECANQNVAEAQQRIAELELTVETASDKIVYKDQQLKSTNQRLVEQETLWTNRVKELEATVQTVTKELLEKNQLVGSIQQRLVENEQVLANQIGDLEKEKDELKILLAEQQMTASETVKTVNERMKELELERDNLKKCLEEHELEFVNFLDMKSDLVEKLKEVKEIAQVKIEQTLINADIDKKTMLDQLEKCAEAMKQSQAERNILLAKIKEQENIIDSYAEEREVLLEKLEETLHIQQLTIY